MRGLADPFAPAIAPPSTGVVSMPTFARHGSEYVMTWSEPPVTMTLGRIHDGSRGVHAEISIAHAGTALHFGELNLLSTSARETLVKRLAADLDVVPWRVMLERACRETVHAVREGEPMVTLTGTSAGPPRELLPRLLYEGEATTIFGDGATGKSLAAMAIAVAMQSGVALPFGFRPARPTRVLYLDWERSRNTAEYRMALLAAGLGVDPPGITYKAMHGPLAAEADTLAAECSRRDFGVVIVDSLIFALPGGENGFHEPVTACYNALRRLAPAAALVLDHVTGAEARADGAARPYGGVFAYNGPSVVWHAKRDREIADATAIAFTCTKANILPRVPEPFGLRFDPRDGAIGVQAFDLTKAAPQTTASANLAYRIRLAVAGEGEMTSAELAAHLTVAEASVARVARGLVTDGLLAKAEGTGAGGRGHAARWRLP